MNVGKSVKIALAQNEKNVIWLAGMLGTSRVNASRIANSKTASQKSIEKVAIAFNMKPSELIALGE